MELERSTFSDGEAQTHGKRGGWITFPFIVASASLLTIGSAGWWSNLIVYLIEKFEVKSIEAAQVSNIFSGCATMFPVVGAIFADSFFGCFSIVWISSLVSLLGTTLLTLTATITSLRPLPCETRSESNTCPGPSTLDFIILYTGIALASVGMAGTRFTLTTIGANQFPNAEERATFFNWYFFSSYASNILASTAIVYVEDNVSWGWGFILCTAANGLGLAIFLCGSRVYRLVEPQGSPFTGLARVVVASIRKRKVTLSEESEDYYHGQASVQKTGAEAPTKSFRFLNCAALITEGEISEDGSIAKPWRLCTVEQVEDLKALIRIFPIWSTSLFLATPICVQASLLVLQALTMDRHLGPHFKIPAGSMLVFGSACICIGLVLLDRVIKPTWQKLTGRTLTPLQLIGVGHVLIILGMAVTALVELKRRSVARSHHLLEQTGAVVPMSVLWLVPQLALVGLGESIQFPSQVELYYRDFPNSLKTMSMAVGAVLVGISFYLGTAVIGCIKRATGWLPNNINKGKLDNVFWLMAAIGTLNLGYFLVCAKLYKYRNRENGDNSSA
ncbi:Nitrate-transporting ATPase [Bertholletia excelsa]